MSGATFVDGFFDFCAEAFFRGALFVSVDAAGVTVSAILIGSAMVDVGGLIKVIVTEFGSGYVSEVADINSVMGV